MDSLDQQLVHRLSFQSCVRAVPGRCSCLAVLGYTVPKGVGLYVFVPSAASLAHLMANAEPVASEPRLFVGQVPTEKTAEDLIPLFEGFGVIKNLHLVKGPDGKSRGCAMVLFDRWSSAEAAMEKHDGKTVLDGGKGRALVVHFANPRKAGLTGMAPEQGVAPKKIFVGQVPPFG